MQQMYWKGNLGQPNVVQRLFKLENDAREIYKAEEEDPCRVIKIRALNLENT